MSLSLRVERRHKIHRKSGRATQNYLVSSETIAVQCVRENLERADVGCVCVCVPVPVPVPVCVYTCFVCVHMCM